PYTSCPSAMKCVPKQNCDFNGVMVNEIITTDPQFDEIRPCVNQNSGTIDVCCRDPNYTDPWPQNN
ncbi:Uncharacterized protein FKW44_000297, partial [Caligus rogercresseyi]